MNVSDIDDIAGRFDISNDEAERIASTVKSEAEFILTWESTDWWTDKRALQDALGLTAKALEASRKAGLDTGEGAAFVAQLEAMMKRLSENAITDQSEEVA